MEDHIEIEQPASKIQKIVPFEKDAIEIFELGMDAYWTNNSKKAKMLITQAASMNYPPACLMLYRLTKNPEDKQAVKERCLQFKDWFMDQSLSEDAKSQFYMGLYHAAIENHVDEVKLFEKSAEQNFAPAQYWIATLYYTGRTVSQDYDMALHWYEKAARQGHPVSQTNLAYYYRDVKDNQEQTIYWFQQAASQGELNALADLGECYLLGQFVEKDCAKGVALIRSAAEQGSSYAQNTLGLCYLKGIGVTIDYVQSLSWFMKSSETSSEAQFQIGISYFHGRGTRKDIHAAIDWFSKAASRKHSNACYTLGNIWYYGLGVAQDYQAAFAFYLKAAKGDKPEALCALARCYEYGEGVEQNIEKARKCLTLNQESDVVLRNLDRLIEVTAIEACSKEEG